MLQCETRKSTQGDAFTVKLKHLSVFIIYLFYLKKIKKMKPAAAEEDLGLWSFVSGCPPLWILPGSQISLACC